MRISPSPSFVSIGGNTLRETDKAVQFQILEVSGYQIDPQIAWIPLSQVEKRITDPKNKDSDSMLIPSWLAGKMDLL